MYRRAEINATEPVLLSTLNVLKLTTLRARKSAGAPTADILGDLCPSQAATTDSP